ncbi:centrosomal protein of 170 kDa-like isoform X2 [Coregonus clupeaformis]|uniref:centrosomal protein of 170 kDa-like isoform X2 n=1 Tax=Coregonus clupeaformis TaxID=59861 RepID=UPI001E1C5511|nr:centrosomal protein of 170 kDa-like isoform X2 [Coregonus clupeaformis]
MSLTSWFLVNSGGTRHRLPREMIFVGRDDCELMLQSRSVDKQHAVINYEVISDEHKVKDLGSLNGTFVNDVRIQEQMYITLKIDDKLRFGYDINLFTVVRGEMTVPDEALQHEKFTSQLQLAMKPSKVEPSKSPAKSPTKTPRPAESKAAEGTTMEPSAKPAESHKGDDKMAGDIAASHRGTPLYGQPSWWGDGDADDENSFKQETKTCGKKHDSSAADDREPKRSERPMEDGLGPEPSYFEIPTKEAQMAEDSIHEIPTKDIEGAAATPSTPTSAQGHASPHAFTIEFDDTSPGKVRIKDHVSNLTLDHRPRPKKAPQPGSKDLSTLQAAMMASESKVADWLAHNDPPMVCSESTEEDRKSIKSDVPIHFNRLKGSKHEDGTQSDSENGIGLRCDSRHLAVEERLRSAQGGQGGQGGQRGQGGRTNRTTFMIEFYDDDNPRKRRSYSFSQTAPLLRGAAGEALCPTPPSHSKAPTMTTASDFSKAPLSAALIAGAPTAARVLMKQRSEDHSIGRSSVSAGHQTTEPSPSEEGQRTPRSQGDREQEDREQEDNQSDKGTYTIELENRNPEEEEARRMIDKVFGVEQNQDPSVSGPVELQQGGGGGKERKATETGESVKPSCLPSKSMSEDPVAVGSSHWVSQWASPAANNTRTDPEGSGAESPAFVHQQRADAFESGVSIRSASSATSSLTERKRRTLPQLPIDDPRAKPGKSLCGLGLHRSEIGEKQDTEPQEKERQVEHKGVGACFTSIEEGDMMNQTKAPLQASSKPSLRPMSSSEKRSEERRRRAEDRIQHHSKGGGDGGERSGVKPLVRQGSFTIEKPSGVVPIELIPRIKGGAGNLGHERSMDTATLLKDTEAVMAFLEAKLRDENKLDRAKRAGSISPESDVDTASTYSQAAGEGEKKAAHQKRRSLSSLHKEKSHLSSSSKTAASTNARERLERKTKTSRPDARRSVQPASSRARQPSQDLTDDDQTSSFPISDILSSDQESLYSHSHGRSHFTSTDDLLHSKLEAKSSSKTSSSKTSKTLQAATASSLGKQASLPQPRPTRTSLLRRARLGDTSDTDLPDTDRMSVASEVSTTSSTSKPPSGRKTTSRLDMLAQPRRTRLGSISARSDSECIVGRSNTSSPRLSAETALRLGLRSSTPTDNKLAHRMRANSVSKLTEAKARISSSVHSTPSASNRWRRLPPEYGSTSEEEFGSNRNSPKPGRPLRPHPVLRGTTSRLNSGQDSPGGVVLKHRMREQQEEYVKDWSAHSEEIARLFPCVRRISQDLTKDLAILAREIHDVAGEIDSVSSSGTAPSTTVSTAATTPGSAIDTREELVDRVFDESLNFRKILPMVQNKASEINGHPVELRPRAPDSLDSALRRRTWNRDEAVLDSLLLTSVSQLSAKIRQSVDKTAGKIRILFKDKDRNWDEIESKLRSESDIPLLKTSNKEISSIVLELKRVEKQLQVINVMVDPDGTLDALSSLGLTSPLTPKPSPGSQGPQKSLPGPAAKGHTASSAPTEGSGSGSARDLGSLHFNHIHPSGEESAITQK